MVGGTREDLGRILHQYVADQSATGPSTIVAENTRVAPAQAAFVNAASGHSLCYDDTSNSMMGHPTIVVLPAVLALAEALGSSGRELLDAYVVGVEVAARVGEILAPGHYVRGWHATGTVGVIGAAAAAARLLDMDASRTRHALGIAASTASGLRVNFGTMSMIYHAGLAARGGVDAALLASRGMTSTADPFGGPKGYLAMFAGDDGKAVTVDNLEEGLGKPFEVVVPGLDVKPYPCGGLSHRAVQGVLDLRRQYGFKSTDVVGVECRVPDLHGEILRNRDFRDTLSARISLSYPVAVALRFGKCDLSVFSEELIRDPEMERLSNLVRIASLRTPVEGNLFAAPAEVTVLLKTDQSLSSGVSVVKGSPGFPLSADEARAKFDECTLPTLHERTAELWAALHELESAGARAIGPMLAAT